MLVIVMRMARYEITSTTTNAGINHHICKEATEPEPVLYTSGATVWMLLGKVDHAAPPGTPTACKQ